MKWFKKLYLKVFGSKCPICEGSGKRPIGKGYTEICYVCHGIGKIKRY